MVPISLYFRLQFPLSSALRGACVISNLKNSDPAHHINLFNLTYSKYLNIAAPIAADASSC